MNLPLPLVELQPGQTLRLHHRTPLHLQVLQGRLWLTVPGSPVDHFVAAGEHLQLATASDGVVLECDSPEPAQWCWLQGPALRCRDERQPLFRQQVQRLVHHLAHRWAHRLVRHQRPGLPGRPAQ